jgi:hypothetical protein
MSHIGVSNSSELVTRSNSARRSGALSALSDRELLSRVKDLVSRERATTLEILVHLNEVERRRLHLGLGYPSLFEYCVRHLGYSSSAAGRRVSVARCIRNNPEVYGLLEKNEINLSSIALVASILTGENKGDLLARIRNRSQKEVEAIVADYRPPVSLRDRARPVCVAVASSAPAAAGLPVPATPSAPSPNGKTESSALTAGSDGGCAASETQRTRECDYSRSGSEKTPNTAAASFAGGPLQATTEVQAQRQASAQPSDDHPSSTSPRLERKFQIQFLASEHFMKKFEKARALLSNKNGKPSYEAVLEAALDEFLKDHDPESRNDRREARKHKVESKANQAKRGKKRPVRSRLGGSETRPARDEEPSRHVPTSTRDEVFQRDKRRCTYVGSNGIRCNATHHLQIDHIVPYARGGTNSVHNLRLLCERHNKLEAERVYGANAMKRFRARE